MTLLLIGATLPIALLAMAMADSVKRYRDRERASQAKQEFELVCDCCGVSECNADVRDLFTV